MINSEWFEYKTNHKYGHGNRQLAEIICQNLLNGNATIAMAPFI